MKDSDLALGAYTTPELSPGFGSTLTLNRAAKPRDAVEVAEQFESLLVQKMLESMRASLGEGELVGGLGSDLARNLLDETLAAAVTHAGGLGLVPMIRASLERAPPITRKDGTNEDGGGERPGGSSSPAKAPMT